MPCPFMYKRDVGSDSVENPPRGADSEKKDHELGRQVAS